VAEEKSPSPSAAVPEAAAFVALRSAENQEIIPPAPQGDQILINFLGTRLRGEGRVLRPSPLAKNRARRRGEGHTDEAVLHEEAWNGATADEEDGAIY